MSDELVEEELTHKEAAEFRGINQEALYGLVRSDRIKPEKVTVSEGSSKYYNIYPLDALNRLKAVRDAHPYRTELTEQQIDDAIQMYQNGDGLIKIGRLLEIGTTRLRKILVDAGLEIRKPPRCERFSNQ